MRFTTYAAPLALAGLVAASPIEKRAYTTSSASPSKSTSKSSSGVATTGNIDDATILQYALTLEHLEAAFYREGLNMYNAGAFEGAGFPQWVRERFTEIAFEEHSHVTTLTAGLTAAGANPVAECTYDFGVTGPESYLALSQVLEGVGVAAYLGAAPSIVSKAYLALAGSILVVEAEHSTWARSAAANLDPFPQTYQSYLDFNQVYTLAAPFIKSCPSSNIALPFKAFPALTVTSKGPYMQGSTVDFTVPKGLSGTVYAAFVTAVGTQYVEVSNSGSASIKIPEGVAGQSYLILTSSKASSDNATLAGPAIVEIAVPATNFDYTS